MKTLGVTRTRVLPENPLLRHCRRWFSLRIGKNVLDLDQDSVSRFWTGIVQHRFVSARVFRRLVWPH